MPTLTRRVPRGQTETQCKDCFNDELNITLPKKEPLPEQLLWEVDRVHMKNRNPIWSSTRVGKDWDGQGEIGEPIP